MFFGEYRFVSAVAFLLVIHVAVIECFGSRIIDQVTDTVNGILSNAVMPTVQNRATRPLDKLKTNEFISYYGYIPEQHQITTQDGYLLTVFRCNSKKSFPNEKRVVVLLHGILCSSDDFVMNPPHQSLAFVLADAGYDVWMANNRGNFYSRNHLTKNPNDRASGFWDFSWDDIGLLDYPATFEYIQRMTNQSKLYAVAHSQGSSALMALLSEKPEYNEQIHAMSLMAPVGYLTHAEFFYRFLSILEAPLRAMRDREIFPRTTGNFEVGSFCSGFGMPVCNLVMNQLLGQKANQRNDSMLPVYVAHTPSGSSTSQLLHYGQQLKYGYFGRRSKGTKEKPPNFPLHQITVPIFIHYSTIDTLSDTTDVKQLIDELTGTSEFYVQTIANGEFDHIDFVWGIQAAEIVYSEIINFFANFQ